MSWVLIAASGAVFTEILGYFLHILLHSEKVPFLSRNHMIHHLRDYGPEKGLRTRRYVSSTQGRANLFGTGLEWILPIAVALAATLALLTALGISASAQGLFVAVAAFWGWFLFGYMHDAMHIQGFWMERMPGLGRWFRAIRKLHDIHHLELTSDGRMTRNYGICFFVLDRIFGTLSSTHRAFNREGYQAARRRYSYVFGSAN